MSDVKKRLYKFLVEMGRITEAKFKEITGDAYSK